MRTRARRIVHVLLVLGGIILVGGASPTVVPGPPTEPGPTSQAAPAQEREPESPAWYRRPAVLIGGGVVAIVLLVGYVQWCTATLRRSWHQLEQVVAERTAEVHRRTRQLEAYNQELRRTNQRLRDTIEEKSRLLGVATHDLKNPLFGIRALSEIVLENEALSDKARRKLGLVRDSAEEALGRINDLMASAASTAQMQFDPEPVDMDALVEWIVHGFAPLADRKDQRLHYAAPDAPCVVEGNQDKLREAVNNLVSNALKYSPPGKDVRVAVDRANGQVCVAVSDHGPGLSEADQQRLFAPFQRLTPTPTGDEGSSGLGLYIVKQIVTLHDGEVEVDSAQGEGSTFRLLLPATTPTVPPSPQAEPMRTTTVEQEAAS